MVTDEEKQEIIDKAVEKALLLLPQVVGNLLVSHTAMAKLTNDFYREHPEFRDHKVAVASVLELVEGRSPGMAYEDILTAAIPQIRERIKTVQALDVATVSKTPARHLPPLKELESPHGEI
jgi:hypothetical protein